MKKLDDLDDLLEAAGLLLDDEIIKDSLPDPTMLMYYRNLANREIWLDTSVNAETLELGKLILHFNKLDAGKPVEERKPIKIYIYSYGGDAAACFNIIDTIEMSKTPVYTYNMGVAMSAAFLILIAGHKRFCTKNSTALVHSGSGSTQGTYEQTEAQMKDYKHTIDVMRDFVLRRTKIDQKKLNKNKSAEWYMYAKEQVENGVVEKIIESSDEL
jgi:ATP-dependent Clp protease protease subunit